MPDRDPDQPDAARLTQLLARANDAEAGGRQAAFVAIYGELRRIAAAQLRAERTGHTLQATALVHEVFLKLVGGKAARPFANSKEFFATAATAMRHILVDHARGRRREKRGGAGVRVPLDALELCTSHDPEVVLAIDVAITELEQRDPQLAELARLRLFGGLDEAETAEVLGSSGRTVRRDWALVRAVLRRALGGDDVAS